MTLNPFIFIKFILYGKIDMKYEISVSELTPPPNFSLIPLTIKCCKKLDFDAQNEEWRNYSEPVMTSSILLWFWIEFVTYFHTSKFCFSWPSNNGNKEGGVTPKTSWIFQTPYHLGLRNLTYFKRWQRTLPLLYKILIMTKSKQIFYAWRSGCCCCYQMPPFGTRFWGIKHYPRK